MLIIALHVGQFVTDASGILFSWRDNSSFRPYTLGPLCLWQCLFQEHEEKKENDWDGVIDCLADSFYWDDIRMRGPIPPDFLPQLTIVNLATGKREFKKSPNCKVLKQTFPILSKPVSWDVNQKRFCKSTSGDLKQKEINELNFSSTEKRK